jgi:hypothetical protein
LSRSVAPLSSEVDESRCQIERNQRGRFKLCERELQALTRAEQQQLQAAAIQQLHDMGLVNPLADLRAYYPEFTDAGGR